jgi:colanic acid/amylovoran biosynthesis glycosyltransferase
MREPLVLAYLTSAYARASDSFIRGEVEQLRRLGFTVHTFSIRRPASSEITGDDVRRERAQTDYVLIRDNARQLATATLRTLLRSPGRLARAAILALRCSSPGLKGRTWALAYLVEACFLAERLRTKRIHHLHNHFGEGSATVAMLAALIAAIPYSLTIHGPSEFDHPASLALDEKIGRAVFVVAVSEYGRSQLLRWSRIDDWPKVKVVHCGVGDGFLRQPPVPNPSSPRLVFVGRLELVKGLVPLVEAARELAREGLPLQLVIIGDGPLRGEIEHLVERYALQNQVTLRGWLGSEAVREEIVRSRAFVLPSFAENLPVAIMEALALGRPVISTYFGGIPELVRDGICGWLVPAGSVPALTDAMRAALTASTDDLYRMGRAGAALVAGRHDARAEAAKLAALFTSHGAGQRKEAPALSAHGPQRQIAC